MSAGLMNPDTLTPDLFDQTQAKRQVAFDKAIAEIDSRAAWPETPEAVAKAYLAAGAQGLWDEVAVLAPGSATRDRSHRTGSQREWAMGKPEPVTGCDQITIRCAFKDAFEKRGKLTHIIYLRNWASRKKRYYIEAGPY